ncbi:MAG: ABC transporter ATP-binding protein [Halolamina sp.]
MSAPAVDLRQITKQFPGVLANDEVDLTVDRGSVHALLGENGAGKTTLMNVLYGLYQPTAGTVVVDGEERTFDSPRDAIDAGVGMIHQHFMLVEPMTVTQNVVLGNEPRKWGGLAIDRERARESVAELADRYGFDVDPTATVADLSVGEQQRIEILKALYRGADILILDEPTAVLTPQEVDELFDVFDELTAAGKTIIFITHKLREVTDAADEVTVLRDGKNVGTVATDDVGDSELAELMVGREVLFDTEKAPVEVGSIRLAARDLVVEDDRGVRAVDGVGLHVAEGEVFGIAGVDGNGQSELVEAITGLRTPSAGTVYLGDEDVTDAPRRQRIDGGMAYVPEDRQARGLVMSYDLTENGLLGSQRDPQFERGGRIHWNDVKAHADGIVEEYDVRPPNVDATAGSLSGGNQQKFIVGREFARDPDAVVASHPTRGVDVGSVEFIHDQLLDLREDGAAVLLVSSKLDEVRSLSDRLGVMHDGELVAVVDPERITEEQLGLLMAGERPAEVPEASRRGTGGGQ